MFFYAIYSEIQSTFYFKGLSVNYFYFSFVIRILYSGIRVIYIVTLKALIFCGWRKSIAALCRFLAWIFQFRKGLFYSTPTEAKMFFTWAVEASCATLRHIISVHLFRNFQSVLDFPTLNVFRWCLLFSLLFLIWKSYFSIKGLFPVSDNTVDSNGRNFWTVFGLVFGVLQKYWYFFGIIWILFSDVFKDVSALIFIKVEFV